jgi:hypothetical protein
MSWPGRRDVARVGAWETQGTQTKEEETMKKALLSLAVLGLTLGLAGCSEKPKEPTLKDVIKEGKDAVKDVKAEADKAVKEAKK